MSRKQLSKKEIKELSESIREIYGIEGFSKKESVELIDGVLVARNGKVEFFLHHGLPVPTLRSLQERNFLKRVVVDMGAVKFVASGADVMRPGIVEADEGILKGDVVAVVDEKNGRPIAVAEAMFKGDELMALNAGKVLRCIHHVGDRVWDGC